MSNTVGKFITYKTYKKAKHYSRHLRSSLEGDTEINLFLELTVLDRSSRMAGAVLLKVIQGPGFFCFASPLRPVTSSPAVWLQSQEGMRPRRERQDWRRHGWKERACRFRSRSTWESWVCGHLTGWEAGRARPHCHHRRREDRSWWSLTVRSTWPKEIFASVVDWVFVFRLHVCKASEQLFWKSWQCTEVRCLRNAVVQFNVINFLVKKLLMWAPHRN